MISHRSRSVVNVRSVASLLCAGLQLRVVQMRRYLSIVFLNKVTHTRDVFLESMCTNKAWNLSYDQNCISHSRLRLSVPSAQSCCGYTESPDELLGPAERLLPVAGVSWRGSGFRTQHRAFFTVGKVRAWNIHQSLPQSTTAVSRQHL